MLARVPPAELLVRQQAEVFRGVRELKAQGAAVPTRALGALSSDARRSVSTESSGERRSSRPFGLCWISGSKGIERPHERLTFHLTQMLSGYGVFGSFLFMIGKVNSSVCEHCKRTLATV